MVVEQNDTSADESQAETPAQEQEASAEAQPGTGPAGDAPGTEAYAGADELDKLREQLSVLEQRAAESNDRMLRAQAELDNVRKRSARDIENAHKYALDRFVTDLLPVIDSIELGINAAGSAEDVASLVEGMDLTLKKFSDVLEKSGVSVLDPAGEKFNPEQHEAVSMQAQEGVEPGMVISVMQKGYELNGRLIRPAMVMVSS
ncbi:MAG: nucleotide exchange factor GrpE [Thiotrichales bacterium]|nr:nucleotide exchange factor GrpE [Thiotrichales bacterium]